MSQPPRGQPVRSGQRTGACPYAPEQALERLSAALAESPPRLDRMALAVATLEEPELEEGPTLARLDALGTRVREVLQCHGEPEALCPRLRALRQVLVSEEGFCGDRETYSTAESSWLPRVLERKRGLPITLSIVWVEVARRAGIPLHGVSFPGHFLVAASEGEDWLVLDPFHAGRSLDEEALRTLLQKMAPELPFTSDLLAPAAVDQVAWRMLSNLRRYFLEKQEAERALGVVDLLLRLAPDHPGQLRTRASLLASLGCYRGAQEDVARCLRLAPDAPDRERLEELLRELEARAALLNGRPPPRRGPPP